MRKNWWSKNTFVRIPEKMFLFVKGTKPTKQSTHHISAIIRTCFPTNKEQSVREKALMYPEVARSPAK
jgi:hypothetical protein